jgi:hypothetical protein
MPELMVHGLQLLALCGLAVAQPVFAVLGEEPTYFVVHGVEGFDLVLFAVALVFIPPAVLFVVLAALRVVSAAAERVTMTLMVGGLVALTIVPALDRAAQLSDAVFVVLLVVIAVGGAIAYARWRAARTFLTFLSPAPALFVVMFLFTSPASALLDTGDVQVLSGNASDTPVVMVVFDEQALGVLLKPDGSLDAERFPGFARLASKSTWYPNATTISLSTHQAVPAILTGTVQDIATPPTASAFPRSLFTMLGRSHLVHADENVTSLCPESICGAGERPVEGSLERDSMLVYLHSLLPDDLASEWLPALGGRWGNFGDVPATSAEPSSSAPTPTGARPGPKPSTGRVAGNFSAFLDSIASASRVPWLWYHHALLPHIPYRHFPDGTEYDSVYYTFGLDGSGADITWFVDADFMDVTAQRLLLQTGYVDHLVGAMLDELEAKGVLDEALVVVTADHGVSLRAGEPLRGPTDGRGASRHEVQPVPLFVKYPHEERGEVDRRDVQITDILPTVADVLDVELSDEWQFEGQSLLGPAPQDRPRRFINERLRSSLEPGRFSARIRNSIVDLPGRRDFVGVAPYGSLVGQHASDLEGEPNAGAVVRLVNGDAVEKVDPAGVTPALLRGTVEGLGADDWLAFAVDGTIVSTGPVYEHDGANVIALLDPKALTPGSHDLRAYAISEDGQSLREVSIASG